MLFEGTMDPSEFKKVIVKLLNDFEALLLMFFPKAHNIFVEEKYIFY